MLLVIGVFVEISNSGRMVIQIGEQLATFNWKALEAFISKSNFGCDSKVELA